MKKNNTILESLQILLTPEEVETVAKTFGYTIKSRKMTVYNLLEYFIVSSVEQSKSYRETVTYAKRYELESVHYSELSKKAGTVPYGIFKNIFHLLLEKCNRQCRRKLKIIKNILAVDSTTITTSKTQLKWAGFHGQRAGIKLHVQFNVDSLMPTMVEESIARRHDSVLGDKLLAPLSIIVEDRAYGKIERFDNYATIESQTFVIRIKENLTLVQGRKLKRLVPEGTNIIDDITCQLGTKQVRSKNRFRVVTFHDCNNNEIRVCTNLMDVTAETIAEIYKYRWTIESFFRFIKQNLNVSRIFGTTENAVYNQLFAALIAYVLLNFLYHESSKLWIHTKLSMIEFLRSLRFNDLGTEVYLCIFIILKPFMNCHYSLH